MQDHQGKTENQDPFLPGAPVLKNQLSPLRKHIPNTLTVLRLLGAPLSVWAILHDQLTLAFWVFLVTSITDWFDGYLARRWHVTSKLGQILDPIADKALIMSVSLTLGLCGFIPLWLMLLILGRDSFILAISGIILIQKKVLVPLEPKFIGKVCTTFQMLFIGLILAGGEAIPSSLAPSSNCPLFMIACLYSAALATIASGIAYGQVAYQAFRR